MECLNLIGNYHIHEKHLELGAGEEAPETGDWLYLWPKELDRTKWTNMDNISPSQSTSRLLYTKMDKYTIGWHLGIRRSLFWRLNYTQRVLVSDKEYFKSNKIIPMMLLQLFVIPTSSSSNFAFAGHITSHFTIQDVSGGSKSDNAAELQHSEDPAVHLALQGWGAGRQGTEKVYSEC